MSAYWIVIIVLAVISLAIVVAVTMMANRSRDTPRGIPGTERAPRTLRGEIDREGEAR